MIGPSHPSAARSSADRIGLGADHEARPLEQLGPVVGRARASSIRSCSAGATPSSGGEVDQHAQHPGPLDVAEELVPEPAALARPLDQPGDVGDDELGVVVEAAPRRGSARAW